MINLKPIGSDFDYRKNSINTLRLLAAFQVMWGHLVEHLEVKFPVIWGGISLDSIISWLLYFFLGVPLFFFLSGFLVWISIDRYDTCRSYYKNRFLRIYPELWMSVLVEIICLIIFVNPINWKDLGLFTFTQATIFQFWTPDSLRVFGCGTPNGSLWTICVMIQFYIVVWFAKKICRRKSIAFWIITELLLMLIGAATKYVELLVPEIVYKLYCNTIVQYLWIFWLGIIIAEYKDTVVSFFARYWYIPLVCAFLFRFSSFDLWSRGYPIIFCTLCLIALIGLAYKLPTMNIRTDISYALFIYHMIVVNVIIELGYADSGIPFVMCILVSFVLAILSTTFVGKNVAKFKVK